MDLKELKDIAICNDLNFIYKNKEISIFMDGNSYIGVYDGKSQNFNKYNDIYKDLDDLINNWTIEGEKLKDIIKFIKLI